MYKEKQGCINRVILNGFIRYDLDSDLYSANDLLDVINKDSDAPFNISQYLRLKTTKDYIKLLESDHGNVLSIKRGREGGTWMHILLLLDFGYAVNPKIKAHDYNWVYETIDDEFLDTDCEYSDKEEFIGAIFRLTTKKSRFLEYYESIVDRISRELDIPDIDNASDYNEIILKSFYRDVVKLSKIINNTDLVIEMALNRCLKRWK